MRVFVDECVTKDLMPHLVGHTFAHIPDTPLRSTRNSALLRAVAPDYDVFLTTDRSIPHQQNSSKFPLSFVILPGVSNKVSDLLPLVPELLAALDRIAAVGFASGDVYRIAPS